MDKSFCAHIKPYKKIPYFKNISYKDDYVKTKLTFFNNSINAGAGRTGIYSKLQLTIRRRIS